MHSTRHSLYVIEAAFRHSTSTINPPIPTHAQPPTSPSGTTLEKGLCVACASGFFKSTNSTDACKSCKKDAVKGSTLTSLPATSTDSCICSKGDYRDHSSDATFIGECKPCPDGAICDKAGVAIETLQLKHGFWRSDINSSNTVQCYNEDACPQNVTVVIPSSSAKYLNGWSDRQCAEVRHSKCAEKFQLYYQSDLLF